MAPSTMQLAAIFKAMHSVTLPSNTPYFDLQIRWARRLTRPCVSACVIGAFSLFFNVLLSVPAHAAGAHTAPLLASESPPTSPQSALVKDRFADVPQVLLETPAFAPNKKDYTTETELAQFIHRKIAPSPHASWRRLGRTAAGRDLHLLVLTQDGRSDPLSVSASRKPNVWVIAQQHGNEPAGAEAALELLRRVLHTDLKQVLEKINVMVVPRANPDGAAAYTRLTASKHDMNRDHLAHTGMEAQKLHAALLDYPPNVVVDAHEFTAEGRWVERFGLAQASDVLVQHATHPGVSEGLKKIAKELFDPALQATWHAHGLKSFVYHTLNVEGAHSFVQMGGNFAGIGRNALGLMGAVSYLIETRGVGINKDHYQRRVASHVLSMVAVLKTAAANADALRNASRESRRAPPAGLMWTVDHAVQRESKSLPMFDPNSGEDKAMLVEFQNSVLTTPTVQRGLPVAYVLPPAYASSAMIARLQAAGLNVARLTQAQELDIEQFTITQIKQDAGEFGAPQDKVVTELKRSKKTVEAGSLWIPMTQGYQPLWRIAAVLFEPEGVGSLVGSKWLGKDIKDLELGQSLPHARVVSGTVHAPLYEPLD